MDKGRLFRNGMSWHVPHIPDLSRLHITVYAVAEQGIVCICMPCRFWTGPGCTPQRMLLESRMLQHELSWSALQILDWTRALPSLHEGSNLLLDKYGEMPWHDWTASATNDLLSDFSEPPPKLHPMIIARMTQAAEQLGAHLPSMSGKIAPPHRQAVNGLPQGLPGSPCGSMGRQQAVLSGRIQPDVGNGVMTRRAEHGQQSLSGPIGMPGEFLTAAHFAATQPLYTLGMDGNGFPVPPGVGTHSAGLQEPHPVQPAAAWVHPAGPPLRSSCRHQHAAPRCQWVPRFRWVPRC